MAGVVQDGLPEGCHHYELYDQVPAEIEKYWHQRYDIFSRYDEGVWTTDESWYGVTPEPVASVIAAYIAEAAPTNKTILIDTFAGVGGNTIAFALSGRWEQIFAIEKDPRALMCAKHNAEIYGVAKKIWWIGGDCFDILKKRLAGTGKNAVVFGSPPWGGPGYISDAVFKLESMQPYNLQTLHSAFTKLTKEVVLFLPRTSDLNELAELQTGDRRLIVTHYCMKGASKALCAYYGEFGVQ